MSTLICPFYRERQLSQPCPCLFRSSQLMCVLDRAPASVSTRAFSSSRALQFRTEVLRSWRQAEWSAVRKSSLPQSAATSFPVMTQEAAQLSGAVFFGSGRSSPACFTGRHVTPFPGVPSSNPWKRSGMTLFHQANGVFDSGGDLLHKFPLLLE